MRDPSLLAILNWRACSRLKLPLHPPSPPLPQLYSHPRFPTRLKQLLHPPSPLLSPIEYSHPHFPTTPRGTMIEECYHLEALYA